jgi:hypothetical protein
VLTARRLGRPETHACLGLGLDLRHQRRARSAPLPDQPSSRAAPRSWPNCPCGTAMLSYSVGYSVAKGHDSGWIVMASELVGVPGLEPETSSLSGCRRSGSNSGFAIVSWAYARSARFSYLAMSCACTRAPWRSRATVGPTLGPGTFRSVDSRTVIRARSDRFVTSALFRIGCPSKSEHPRSCSSAWLPAGCSFRRRTRARSRWFLCSRAFAYWRPCPIRGLEAGPFGGSAGRRQ